MKTLIIYAHPNHHSLCHAFLLASQSGLEQTQQEYRTIDLHQDQFDPVLIYNKEQRRRDMHKVPELEKYCKEEKIPFKILLLIDNAPAHPPELLQHPNVKVLFMPPNTTPVLQPMDQGVIKNFKSHYLRHTLSQAIATVDSKEQTLIEFR